MDRIIAYVGRKFTIVYAKDGEGNSPGAQFFYELSLSDKAKLSALFVLLADLHSTRNPEKFGDLGNGIFELKSFQIRMPFAYSTMERGVVMVTHGFVKKRGRTPPSEIERARRILAEDTARSAKQRGAGSIK